MVSQLEVLEMGYLGDIQDRPELIELKGTSRGPEALKSHLNDSYYTIVLWLTAPSTGHYCNESLCWP